jgi:hypothetical protein
VLFNLNGHTRTVTVSVRTVTVSVHFPKCCELRAWICSCCGSREKFWIMLCMRERIYPVAVQITTTLNCLITSFVLHKLLPGNISCWHSTGTSAVDRLIYWAWLFGDSWPSLSTLIINFSVFYTISTNCEIHWTFSTAQSDWRIPVLSLPLAHTMAWNSLFSEPILGSFRYHLPSYKQVYSLCAVTKRTVLLATKISNTKAATIPQTG